MARGPVQQNGAESGPKITRLRGLFPLALMEETDTLSPCIVSRLGCTHARTWVCTLTCLHPSTQIPTSMPVQTGMHACLYAYARAHMCLKALMLACVCATCRVPLPPPPRTHGSAHTFLHRLAHTHTTIPPLLNPPSAEASAHMHTVIKGTQDD